MPSPSRYYIGQRVESNALSPSDATDWRAFVQHHLHVPALIHYTQSEFFALDKPARDKAKMVSYAVPGTFPEGVRKQDKCGPCNLIWVDIDHDKATGRYPAAPFLADPDMLARQLSPYNFAAYTTASSTPEQPRIRIVVDAEGIAPASYEQAVRTIVASLGLNLTEVDPVSLRFYQPMFLPSIFADQPEDSSPVFACHTSGRAFQPADMGEFGDSPNATVLPRKLAKGDPDPNDLLYLRAPVLGFTLQHAAAALGKLSPDDDYAVWLEMAAALKHQFGHTEDDDAYTLFDTWSRSGGKYGGEEDTLAKWRSLQVHPTGRAPVTIRSLVKRAMAAGWEGAEEVKRETAKAIETWLLTDATETDFEIEAPKRIADLPLANAVQISRLVTAVVRTAKQRFELILKEAAVHKEVKRAAAALHKQSTTEKDWPEWAQGICYVQTSCEFYSHRKCEKLKPAAVDASFGRYMSTTDDGRPTTKASEYLLHTLECPTPYDYTYDPTQPDKHYPKRDGHMYVNTYSTKGRPKPTEHGAEEAGELFMTHLENLIKEAAYRRIVTDWLAFHVQYPGIKIRWALFLQGVQGGGKGFIGDLMRAMLGPGNVKLVELDSVKGSFSEWSTGAQMVVIDEIFVAGHNRHEIMNKLKPLITNDCIGVTQKFRDARTEYNITNYFVMTNQKGAIVVSEAERRYCVIESRIQTEEQAVKLSENGYFEKLFTLTTTRASAMRYFFENWQISSDFKPNGRAPKTKYFHELVHDCANEETATVRRVIEQGGDPLIMTDLVGVENLRRRLQAEDLRLSMHRIGKVLRDEGYARVDKLIQVDGLRQCFYRKQGMLNGTTDIAEVVRQRAKLPIEGEIH